jgi:exopolyphosphatase/guanosine-5'-triphosphate,3'-diphosphate pyrophosphatase
MTVNRIAVIDLGSNTFHLLICEVTGKGQWAELHKEKEYVKLASEGLARIDSLAEQRAIDAMLRFAGLIRQFNVTTTRAIGTAALREAQNGTAIAEKLSSITGIPIEIIDGDDEAAFILDGIRSVLPSSDQHSLIMDIGGGSVEFILYRNETVSFARSFKLGVAVLYRMFHKEDPISQKALINLEQHLDVELAPLLKILEKVPDYRLVGASGSFEVLHDGLPKISVSTHWAELDRVHIEDYLTRIINSTLEERKEMPEIPEERLDYIVVACALIRWLFTNKRPSGLVYCEYALKEGVVSRMVNITI